MKKVKNYTKKERVDVYQLVTDRVIEGLKEKGLSWFKSWTDKYGNHLSPINNATGKEYRGINIFLLNSQAVFCGYECNEWVSFKQAQDKGGNVRKGEKSTETIYWIISFKYTPTGKYYRNKKELEKDGLKENDKGVQKFFTPKIWRVFNIAQCDGIEPIRKPQPMDEKTQNEIIKDAEAVYDNYNKKPFLNHGGNSAYYRPSTHSVQMPEMDSFLSSDDYYHVLFHELIHSTGHEDCLNRKTLVESQGFGSTNYSKEELVAEIGAEFLSSIIGLTPKSDEKNSQAYINGWIKELKDKPKMILQASQQSTKAVEYILTGK
jgi:antirestriction protein ArdC